jgi:hypothetical protein
VAATAISVGIWRFSERLIVLAMFMRCPPAPHGAGDIVVKSPGCLQRQTSAIGNDSCHSGTWRNRNALLTTDTEDRLMASAAIIGDNVIPSSGYNTPAASGTPTAL